MFLDVDIAHYPRVRNTFSIFLPYFWHIEFPNAYVPTCECTTLVGYIAVMLPLTEMLYPFCILSMSPH